MKLTKTAIETLDRPLRLDLALALGFSETWINRLVEANKDNGPLTTAKSLQVLRDKTGMQDSQLLEETNEIAA
jgi:hypothetical protein